MKIPQYVIDYYTQIRNRYGKFILSYFMKEIPDDVLQFINKVGVSAKTLNVVIRRGYTEYPILCVCGNVITNIKRSYCSDECAKREGQKHFEENFIKKFGCRRPSQNKFIMEKTKQTNLEKYGCEYSFQADEVKKKIEESLFNRYGTQNPSQSKEVVEKRKQTNNIKYGGNAPLSSVEIRNKVKNTNLKKYGVENVFQAKEIIEKIQETNILNYGTPYYKMSDAYKIVNNTNAFLRLKDSLVEKNNIQLLSTQEEFLSNKRFYKCLICGETFENKENSYIFIHCPHCSKSCYSLKEKEVVDYIKSIYDGEIIENDRTILQGKELDIYISEYNLAIEFNGSYWHSNIFCDDEFHLNKTVMCLDKNIKLIHIFENYWDSNKEVCKSIISKAFGLYKQHIIAETCSFKEIDINAYSTFVKQNTLYNLVNKYSICYGLYYDNELVAVLGLVKNNEIIVIDNYCTSIFTNVVNGLKVLLDKSSTYNCVIYIDRNISFLDEYENVGFVVENYTPPKKHFYKMHTYQNVELISSDETYINNKEYCWISDCGDIKMIL